MIVVDTDVLIEIFDKGSPKGDEALRRIRESDDDICITSINLHEILYGLQKYAKPVEQVQQLPVLSYTKRDANLAAHLELEAEKKGMPIRRTDAMIAAITINNGAHLYTFDTRHSKTSEIFGLKLLT